MTSPAGSLADGPDRGRAASTRARDVEVSVRKVRWLAVAFVFVQFALFTPTGGGALPFPRWPVAVAVASVLVVTNLLSLRVTRSRDEALLARWGTVALVLDASVTLAVMVLFGFDEGTRMWPVATFPIIEGAMRAQYRGAMLTWLYLAGGYVVEQVLRLPGREEPSAWIGSIPWGAGILLFVAIGTGVLARRLAEVSARLQVESERLRHLASTGPALTAERTTSSVFAGIVRSGMDLLDADGGFVLGLSAGDVWTRHAAIGPAEGRVAEVTSPAISELVGALTGPVLITPEGDLARLVASVAGRAAPVILVPIRRGIALIGLLGLVTLDERRVLDALDLDTLALLASQATVAIENAHLAETEERTIAELRELDELKDDFVSVLTHELRSPMTAIAGFADLLVQHGDRLPPEKQREFLRRIKDNTHALTVLMDEVLDATKAERHDLEVQRAPVDLGAVATAVAEGMVSSTSHQLVLQLDPGVPYASGDRLRLRQVVTNLISNAVKYSPDGGRVTVRVFRSGAEVALAIEDEGLGIPVDARSRLFEKFSRLHPDAGIRGTGLGLYLSKQLVEAMDGTIEVDSVEGEGSTFTIRLPVAADQPDATPRVAAPEAGERAPTA